MINGQHRPLFYTSLTVQGADQEVGSSRLVNLGQETEPAGVDAKDRHAGGGRDTSDAQQCAVAADADNQAGV